MLFVCRSAGAAVLATVLVASTLSVGARADDSAEIALWNVVRKSQDPSDYTSYLRLFPQGRFAALARIKLAKLGGTPPAAATESAETSTAAPDAAPATAADASNLYHLDVWPRVATMGQNVTVKCRGLESPALFDRVVVVKAGAPDFDPSGNVDEKHLYWSGLPRLYDCAGAGIALPMMMAGTYEVRYLSRQYNPDGVLQVVARAGFLNR